MNEPVADAARSILDGHCVLSRELAHRNHYPAIDVLGSVSRLATEIVSPEVLAAGGTVREALAVLRANEDLISIGAYAKGSSPRIDAAIDLEPEIERFLRQGLDETADASVSDVTLCGLAAPPPPAAEPA
jgi:flagellum-specific ATP synthase